MRRSEILKKYGKEMYDKIMSNQFMKGITVSFYSDGSLNIPERDVENAVKDVAGKEVSNWD